MMSKALFLVLLLTPLFLAAEEIPGSSEGVEGSPDANGTVPEGPSQNPDSPIPPASSDSNSTTSDSSTSTTSGTSHISWTNALVLALAILLKQM